MREKSPHGAVLFDFGGTLDSDGLRWSVRFHAAYAARGGRIDQEAFEPLFRTSDRTLEALPGIRRLGFRAMIEAQAHLLRGLLPDGEVVAADAVARQVHDDAVRVVMRNRPVLDALRADYRLAIVSNFAGNLSVCLAELGLGDVFDVVTDSAILGAAKPDPLPFTHTLALLDVPPSRAWIVGDNFDADIVPAHWLGMRTVWIAPSSRPLPPGCVPTARIATFAELTAVVPLIHPTARGQASCTA